jgi:hypothetical protein
MTYQAIQKGTIISLPSFDPSGRSLFTVDEIRADSNGTYVYLAPVNPDGHYVSNQIGVRTLADTLANGRVISNA